MAQCPDIASGMTPNPTVEGTRRDKAASRPSLPRWAATAHVSPVAEVPGHSLGAQW